VKDTTVRLVKMLTEQQSTSAVKDNVRPAPSSAQDPDELLRQLRAHYAAHPLPHVPPPPARKYATLPGGDGVTLTEAQAAAARRQLLYGDRRPSLPAGAHARLIAAFTR
jgi:hypothetical protein